MKWVDMGILSATGFQQQGYLSLILYIYAVVKLYQNKPINRVLGIISSLLAIVARIAFALSKSDDFFGESINAATTGLYVFIITAILLTVKIFKYEKTI